SSAAEHQRQRSAALFPDAGNLRRGFVQAPSVSGGKSLQFELESRIVVKDRSDGNVFGSLIRAIDGGGVTAVGRFGDLEHQSEFDLPNGQFTRPGSREVPGCRLIRGNRFFNRSRLFARAETANQD